MACAHSGVLTPAALFLYIAPTFFFSGLREAQLRGEVTCGMPAAFAGLMVLMGAAAELFVGLLVQLSMFIKQRNLSQGLS